MVSKWRNAGFSHSLFLFLGSSPLCSFRAFVPRFFSPPDLVARPPFSPQGTDSPLLIVVDSPGGFVFRANEPSFEQRPSSAVEPSILQSHRRDNDPTTRDAVSSIVATIYPRLTTNRRPSPSLLVHRFSVRTQCLELDSRVERDSTGDFWIGKPDT